MTNALRLVWSDKALRAAGAVIALQGAVVCTLGPYFSTLAVSRFGFGDGGYAILLSVSTLLAVSASVYAGIRADQTANRRGIVLAAVIALVLGMALMTLMPTPAVFALTMAVLFPISSITFGQVFALARMAGTTYPVEARDGIMAVIRALFALPFVVVLPLWSVIFARGAEVLLIFPAGLVLSAAMLALVTFYWPRNDANAWQDRPSGLSLRAALVELRAPGLLARVMALGAVNAVTTVYMALVSLIMVAEVGRGPGDVALYVGLIAGLEVPFMLMLPMITPGRSRTALIFAGTALYAVHVAFLPVLAGSSLVWLLVLPAAIGGAVILTVPIAYLQDLLADRPGTGASLMAVQRLVGDVLAAGCFVLGTLLAGYGLVAILGVAVAVTGAGLLWWGDTRAKRIPADAF